MEQEFNTYVQSNDGSLTPADIKQFFTDQGYDIEAIAHNDPNYLNPLHYNTVPPSNIDEHISKGAGIIIKDRSSYRYSTIWA